MKNDQLLDPGKLRHRLDILEMHETPDGCGGTTVSWVSVGQTWAAIQTHRNLVRVEAQQKTEVASQQIVIRFRGDIRPGWRLQSSTQTYQVVTVHSPDEMQR